MARQAVVAQFESGSIIAVYKSLRQAKKILHAYTFVFVDEFDTMELWKGTYKDSPTITLEVHPVM